MRPLLQIFWPKMSVIRGPTVECSLRNRTLFTPRGQNLGNSIEDPLLRSRRGHGGITAGRKRPSTLSR